MIAFILRRRSYLKTLGSVIDAAVRRKHTVCLVLDPDGKELFQPGDLLRWASTTEVVPREPALALTIGVRHDGDRVHIAVPQFFDDVKYPPSAVHCYLSQYHKDLHRICQPAWAKQIEASPIVGWTLGDHRALITSPRVHGAYSVFYTMKRRVPEPWRRSWHGRMAYAQIILNYIKAGEQLGWKLVAKTRPKHGDPFWLRHIMDTIGEESVYPATSSILAAYARCAIHFESGAGLEARWYGCPDIAIRVPREHLRDYPGVEQVYADVFGSPLSTEEYIQRYLGYNDTNAGERVMDVVEGCLKTSGR